jgi:hypothetical protein
MRMRVRVGASLARGEDVMSGEGEGEGEGVG